MIEILLTNNIPHNVVMYRGAPFNACSATSSVIRILVIPRKPVYGTAMYGHPLHSVIILPYIGIKELYEDGRDMQPFCAAACELGLGFIPVIGKQLVYYDWDSTPITILIQIRQNIQPSQKMK